MTSITDPDGRVTSLTYDAQGNKASVSVSPSGGINDTTEYAYDVDGELTCTASADAVANGISCLSSGTTRIAGTTSKTYDAGGEVTSVTNADGATVLSSYDADGNLIKTTDADGNTSTTTYDLLGRKLTVTTGASGSSPSTTTYTYDVAPGSASCASSVVGETFCNEIQNASASVTVDYYNAANEVVDTTSPGGLSTQVTYDAAGNAISRIDAAGRTTTYTYDADNRVTGTSYSDGTTPAVTYTYDADGNRLNMTDGTGSTTYSYDADAQLLSTTNGDGATTFYAYDGAGNVTTITYANGQVVTQAYDGAGRMVSIADGIGDTTSFSYDADGNLTGTVYPNSDSVTSTYDPADQLTSTGVAPTAQPSSQLAGITYTRNAADQITQEADRGALSGTTNYAYDASDQLTSAGGSTYSYDPLGDLTSLPGSVSQTFNAAQELTHTTGAGETTSYSYDTVGDRAVAAAPNTTTSYGYNQASELTSFAVAPVPPVVSAISPTSGPTAGGTSVTITGSGLSNATAVDFGTTPAETLQVNSDSSITATSPAGTGTQDVTVMTPGGTSATGTADRFTYQSSVTPPVVSGISPTSGATGGGTSVTISGSGFTGATAVNFGTTAAPTFKVSSDTTITAKSPAGTGGVDVTVQTPNGTSATSPADVFTYGSGTPLPVVANVVPATGLTAGGTHVTISGSGFMGATSAMFGSSDASAIKVKSDTSITADSPAGSGIVDVTVTTPAGTSTASPADRFTYETVALPVIGRLKNRSGPSTGDTSVLIFGRNLGDVKYVHFGRKRAQFTLVFNRRGLFNHIVAISPRGHGIVDVSVTTLAGKSAAVHRDRFTYIRPAVRRSAASSQPTDRSGTYVAGSEGSKSDPSQAVPAANAVTDQATTYSYNGDGLRMAKNSGGIIQQFTWNTNESDPALLSDSLANYIYGPNGLPIEQIATGGQVNYYFHDALGSTRLLLNSAGNISGTMTYSAEGSPISVNGPATTPLQYAGGYRDAESGLYYLVDRYYDPASAQFMSIDPALAITLSPYGYANDDPSNLTDPLGLSWWNPTTWTAKTWGNVALGVGIVAGLAAVCVLTACIGDVAVGLGVADVAGLAATAGEAAELAGTGSALIGAAADSAVFFQDGCARDIDTTICEIDTGAIVLDGATALIGGRVASKIGKAIFGLGASGVTIAYDLITNAIQSGDAIKC